MTHSYPHKQFGEGFEGSSLDTSCEECLERMIGGLDDQNFQLLTGQTRAEFEGELQDDYNSFHGTGLYNFWYAIMGSNAIMAFARKGELMHRHQRNSPDA